MNTVHNPLLRLKVIQSLATEEFDHAVSMPAGTQGPLYHRTGIGDITHGVVHLC